MSRGAPQLLLHRQNCRCNSFFKKKEQGRLLNTSKQHPNGAVDTPFLAPLEAVLG